MITSNDQKVFLVTPPGAIVDNAALATAEIDTIGYDYVDVYVAIGATDVAMTALKLQHSDVSGSGFVDLAGANFATGKNPDGTSTTLPSATADNTFVAFHVKLNNGKKRFLDVVATGGDGAAGAYIAIFAVLSRAKESPRSTTDRGLAQEIYC